MEIKLISVDILNDLLLINTHMETRKAEQIYRTKQYVYIRSDIYAGDTCV